MIEAQGLKKAFARKGGKRNDAVQAVTDVPFVAQDGQITGLLGANGAGKSTTLRILATLMQADSGWAKIDGVDVNKNPLAAREHFGYLPHNSGLYPRLSAKENIEYYGRLYGLSARQAQNRADELVDLLDMQDIAQRRTEGFSQGQKTKVGLARAMVHSPNTLLLDEPTNGLDVIATRALRKTIRGLRDQGHCILFSSHIMQEVAALCDHIAIICDGKVALAGSVAGIRQLTGQYDLEDAFVVAIGGKLE
ncbi:MAG: ATP-binding cassette domain-containing protein [Cellvibrionaceae bacterium]|nr:ATP-binding cassette domain-containing protein [Cellvibrionaceae bacterium]